MTETKPTVYQAWTEVMEEVRAIAVNETGSGISYKFRGVNSVLNAFGPVLRRHGVIVYPSATVAECRDFTNNRGNRQHEAILTVDYTVVGPAGDSFVGQVVGESADSSDKSVPQAMSVALRTFLLQAATVPTDDPEPDLNVVERANATQADEEAAWAQGWASVADRAKAWKAGLERMNQLPDDHKAMVIGWGKALDEPLGPDSLTVDMAVEWKAMMEGESASTTLDVPRGTPPEPEAQAETPPFDRAAAWALLREKQASLAKDAVASTTDWLHAQNITEAELTIDQARAAFEFMSLLPAKEEVVDPKSQGWKSAAERKRTYESLQARMLALKFEPGLSRSQEWFDAHEPTEGSLDKATATEWNAVITEAEDEPF